MFIASDIASPLIPPQAPAALPNAQPQSNSQPNTQTTDTQTGNQTQTDAAQGNGQNSSQTDNTIPQAQGNDHFSKLLSAGQPNPQPQNKGSVPSAPSDSNNSDTPAANVDPKGTTALNASAALNGNANAVALVVLSQLQSLGGTDSQLPTNTPSQIAPNSPLQDTAFLQKLQQILQQLLAQAENASAGSTPQDTASPQTPQTNTPATGNQQTASPSNQDATSLPQLLAQLAAMLQSLVAQTPPQQTSVQLTVSSQDTGSIDANGGSSTSGSDLLARLSQLLQTFQQPVNTGDSATGAAAPDTTTTNNATPVSFDTTLNTLLQQTDTKAALQAALSDVTQLLALAPAKGDKSGNNNDSNDNPQSAATNNPQPLSTPAPQQPSTPETSFTKLLPSASSVPPAVDQVLVQIKSAADTTANQIRIQLDPADLGKVVVQLNTGTDGKTGITITADNRQTLSMLQNEARSLESALRDIGLKTDTGGLNFNLSGQQQQNPGNTGKNAGYTQVAAITDEDTDYQTTVTQLYRYTAQDGLDIRV